MDRFVVMQTEISPWDDIVYWIRDTQAKQYHLPEMGSTLYFQSKNRAQAACNILNSEWQEFEANPY